MDLGSLLTDRFMHTLIVHLREFRKYVLFFEVIRSQVLMKSTKGWRCFDSISWIMHTLIVTGADSESMYSFKVIASQLLYITTIRKIILVFLVGSCTPLSSTGANRRYVRCASK